MRTKTTPYTVKQMRGGKFPLVQVVGPTLGDGVWASQLTNEQLADHLNAAHNAAAPSLTAENALLAERVERLRVALDKDVARFDGILGDMPRLARMTPTERMSYDAKIAAYRNEAREILTSLTPASR